MSLQVWLPLTKDLRQQGLDNITVITTNTNNFQNEGKLSNKSLDVLGHYAFRVPSLVKKRVFSCAFWYKPIADSSLSENWKRIIVFDTYTSDGSTAGAIFRFESSYGYQSSSTTYCISIHNNVGEPIASIGTGLGETDGQTMSNPSIKIVQQSTPMAQFVDKLGVKGDKNGSSFIWNNYNYRYNRH